MLLRQRNPPEEGAWLEAADGKRHPIKVSCSRGRTAATTIVLESPKVSRRHALIHLQNKKRFGGKTIRDIRFRVG
jgi:pSer/pThr/pTyr-binding forkhead associated (FHA) protein